ncbi:UbiA prenyltransferase family-domain-containing protein [Aspergillus egyptiacus]|nr:UbiA prenyltransferase family-domain-containing protein [Aspergillus egyptiacus]
MASSKSTSTVPFLSSLCYHAYTAHFFVRDNIKEVICLGMLFGALNAAVASDFEMGASRSFREILVSLPQMFLWSWTHLFYFTLHNQCSAAAIAEDKINKPWRPLPAGRITPRQAKVLVYCMYPTILAVSYTVGGVGPCLVGAFLTLWYNEWHGASDPLLKNFLNGLGFACFFAGPLEIATKSSVLAGDMKAFMWLLVIAGAIATAAHAQDFLDIEGDRASGRKTVPLLIGDANARSALALGIIGWTALSCWFWDLGSAGRSWRSCIPACVAGTIVISGFYWDKIREADQRSWKIYPIWLVGLFLMPLRIF